MKVNENYFNEETKLKFQRHEEHKSIAACGQRDCSTVFLFLFVCFVFRNHFSSVGCV